MATTNTVVGFVQIGGLEWVRRPAQQFHIVDGVLLPKPLKQNASAKLAYIPHVAGLLQAYVMQHASDPSVFSFLPPIYRHTPSADAVNRLLSADVVGFSVYVWNVRATLAIAEALRAARPDVLIVFGGPQVPDDSEAFLRENPFIDLACHGEGERTFLEILERAQARRFDDVASVSYLSSDGSYLRMANRPRLTDLDEIPSPFLQGVFDVLMRCEPDQHWLATWETNRGCPFACTFCDWGSATASKLARYSQSRLYDEIDWFVEHGIQHLFVCDANFGMLLRDVEIAERLAQAYAARGTELTISVQNTKNRTDRSEQIQRIFRDSGVVSFGASISLQSVSQTTLKSIQRDNISLEAFEDLQQHYSRQGIESYTDLIIGLPGETYDSFTDGVTRVIRNGQYNRIAFYECSILPNAPMAKPEYRREHGLVHKPVRLIQAYDPLDASHAEQIDLVVATATMGQEDWRRARVFADMCEFLFFNRLLHIPLVLLDGVSNASYRAIFEAFIRVESDRFPTVAAVRQVFESHAESIIQGRSQYISSDEWLGVWWPADQYALIELGVNDRLDAFYAEAEEILLRYAAAADPALDPQIVEDAVRLNRKMLTLPFQWNDEVVESSYPIAEWYQAKLAGRDCALTKRPELATVVRCESVWFSWEDWQEELVKRMYHRQSFLYPLRVAAPRASSGESPELL